MIYDAGSTELTPELVKLLKSPLENETILLVLACVVKDLCTLMFVVVLKTLKTLILSENAVNLLHGYCTSWLGSDAAWVCRVSTLGIC